jgi:acetate kinase
VAPHPLAAPLPEALRVLVVNAGSSSLKLSVLDGDRVLFARTLAAPGGRVDEKDLSSALAEVEGADAVGHRIVHGGDLFSGPVQIDDEIVRSLHELTELAPLHQEKSLGALEAVARLLPGVPMVACFDTAFHATLPAEAATYALPRDWRGRWPLRRFGFHGLSHAYASRRAADLVKRPLESLRIVTCHLGAGASLAAIAGGVSVDTTMGFTPLEGLAMATRSGSVDPGLVLWLVGRAGLPAAEVEEALEHRSGLLGLAGTSEMASVVARAKEGDADAQLALGVYTHRLRGSIALMASALEGLDVLVFTGGVGERSAHVRAAGVEGLGFLRVQLDEELNAKAQADAVINTPGDGVAVLVVAAREDLEIARQVRSVLSAG